MEGKCGTWAQEADVTRGANMATLVRGEKNKKYEHVAFFHFLVVAGKENSGAENTLWYRVWVSASAALSAA